MLRASNFARPVVTRVDLPRHAGPMIDVAALSKSYRVHKRAPGIAAALRSVFRRRYETVKAVEELSFRDRGRRAGRLPGPQRRRQDHHAQGARRPAAPDGGRGPGRTATCRTRATALPQADHAGDGAEAAAALGPAAGRDLRAEPRHLRRPARAGRRDAPRADRAARARRPHQQADAPAVARRADEVRAGGGAAAPPARAVPRRADHRPRRVDAGDDARLHPRLQRALRRHGAPDQPLHGRRRRRCARASSSSTRAR